MKKDTKKNHKVFFKYLLITLISLLIITFVSISILCFLDSFNISNVVIEGNGQIDEASLNEYVDEMEGVNGFKALFKHVKSLDSIIYVLALRDLYIENEILKNEPYIEKTKVSFVPPNKLKIEIVERKPLYIVSFLNKYIILDEAFNVLEEIKKYDESLILIEGIEVKSIVLGEKIEISESLKEAFNTFYENSIYEGRNIMDEMNSVKLEYPYMYFTLNKGFRAKLDIEDDLGYHIKCLNDIYFENVNLVGNGTLDFTKSKNAIFVKDED